LLSGSTQPTVGRAVTDSLHGRGRVSYRTLRPLTLAELRLSDEHAGWSFLFDIDEGEVLEELRRRAEASGALDWPDVVRTGGFPRAVATSAEHRIRELDNYVAAFARRDIRDVIGVESSERFEAFLRLLATRTGHLLNIAGMATDLGIAVTTARRWTDALIRSYLVELIPAYSRDAGHRTIKAPKIVMVDSALAMAAARERDPTAFHLETLVATDLAVWRDNAPDRGLYHWRLSSGQEVDFVLEEDGRLLPIEIKVAANPSRGDARHLHRFRNDHPTAVRGLLLSSDDEIRVLAPGILAAPWWSVL
jgi:predicted AAA+ superfamily ATPase